MIVDADEPLAQAARLRSDARRCRSFACRITVELLADPIFMAVAVIGVCLLGISKGGFLGMGVMALPLMSLFVPPLQAAAIILPTAIAQDLLTLWVYRREWSPWNLKIMLPSMFVGMCIAWLLAASLSAAHIRLAIGLIAALFVLRHWLSKRFERYTQSPASRPALSSARSAASPPCWPTPGGLPGRSICCRRSWRSCRISAR
jgi:uncharacterized membrane protein YfcA